MERAFHIIAWIFVLALAAWLRFDDLSSRPFHADEATGARITAQRMEGGGKFDPKHYHGPVLGDLAIPLCKVRGESSWQTMSKGTLRILPAVAGCLLVLAPLLWVRRFGSLPALAAALFIATSPLLVYYSRMFIHEMLLALFGVLALAALTAMPRGPRPLLAGLCIGLMYATKESFAISMIAWSGAVVLTVLCVPRWWDRRLAVELCRSGWRPLFVCGITALTTAGLCYTGFLTHPRGAVDAVRTFFVYEVVEGHDKPFFWYLELMAWPKKAAGIWWFETPVLLLALVAYLRSFGAACPQERAHWVRFLVHAAACHFLIYSVIAYKTPWLLCLPWAHLCLAAGFALTGWHVRWKALPVLSVACVAAVVAFQFQLARKASGRLASNARNPYAYVPTRRDVEDLESWLAKLRPLTPPGTESAAAVVGADYWPLPWYLRAFERVGYWPEPPAGLGGMAFVFAMPDAAGATSSTLESTHQMVPQALRAEVPLLVFVRNDIWKQWMEAGR